VARNLHRVRHGGRADRRNGVNVAGMGAMVGRLAGNRAQERATGGTVAGIWRFKANAPNSNGGTRISTVTPQTPLGTTKSVVPKMG